MNQSINESIHPSIHHGRNTSLGECHHFGGVLSSTLDKKILFLQNETRAEIVGNVIQALYCTVTTNLFQYSYCTVHPVATVVSSLNPKVLLRTYDVGFETYVLRESVSRQLVLR